MLIFLYGDIAQLWRHDFVFGTHIRALHAGAHYAAEYCITFVVQIRQGEGVLIGIRIAIYHDVAAHATFVVTAPHEAHLGCYGDRVAQTEGAGSAKYGIHDEHIVLWNEHIVALRLQYGASIFVGAGAVEFHLALDLLIDKPLANLHAMLQPVTDKLLL